MQPPYSLDCSINLTPKVFQLSDSFQSGHHFFFIGKRSHKLPHQQTVMEYPECAVTAELYAVFSFLPFLKVIECNI